MAFIKIFFINKRVSFNPIEHLLVDLEIILLLIGFIFKKDNPLLLLPLLINIKIDVGIIFFNKNINTDGFQPLRIKFSEKKTIGNLNPINNLQI